MDITNKVVSYILESTFSDFPQDVIARAKECLLDSLGAIVSGSRFAASKIAAEFAKEAFGPGKSRILGTGYQVSPIGAAFANATANSVLDIDDAHRGANGHPGSIIFPSGFALAQSQGPVDGKRFLEAVIIAYEVGIRISGSRSNERRFSFSTGSWGAFASAVVAGKLLKLTKEQMKEAIRITIAHHPLPPIRKSYLQLGMVKEATGWASMTGCSAAILASLGFTGMESIIDDPEYHDPNVFDDLGINYEMRNISFKLYPSCRWNHVILDLVLELREKYQIIPTEIQEISVKTFRKASQMSSMQPLTLEDAQYSVPFLASVALWKGQCMPDAFSEEKIKDREILSLASKVRLEFWPEFEALFPQKWLSQVEILTGRGRFSALRDSPRGDPDRPLSSEELKMKFRSLVSDLLAEETYQNILDVILNIEHQDSFNWLDLLS
jgi:2-methylcitrate dehydratase PrpD